MWVRCVLDDSDGTVGLVQAVSSLDNISMAGFVLVFLVTGMRVGYSIFVFVVSWCLDNYHYIKIQLMVYRTTVVPVLSKQLITVTTKDNNKEI